MTVFLLNKGIREFVPVYFNDLYYSQVSMTVHTALISKREGFDLPCHQLVLNAVCTSLLDYSFRYVQPKMSDKEKQQQQ